MSEELIRIEHLKKEYEEAVPLTDVNASVYRGDVIAVIGPSGTGKSTLLRCINRLEKPTAGKICVLGTEITDKSADIYSIRRKMGMVFQSFNLFDNLTCLENIIAAPMDIKKISRSDAEKKALELLKMVGMQGREDAFPMELSGGQKQRVAIARALAMDPEILLLDEPTSALDPKMGHEVERVIRKLAESGMTMLIVTHGMEFARNVCNRVFFMCDGIVYEEGSPEEIFEHPKRDKTREFMLQDKCFEMELDPHDYDEEDIMFELQKFLGRNGVEARQVLRVHGLFEKIAVESLLQKLNCPGDGCRLEIDDIKFKMIATDDLYMKITFSGEEYDPLTEAGEQSLKLLREIAECSYTREGNVNIVDIKMHK